MHSLSSISTIHSLQCINQLYLHSRAAAATSANCEQRLKTIIGWLIIMMTSFVYTITYHSISHLAVENCTFSIQLGFLYFAKQQLSPVNIWLLKQATQFRSTHNTKQVFQHSHASTALRNNPSQGRLWKSEATNNGSTFFLNCTYQ